MFISLLFFITWRLSGQAEKKLMKAERALTKVEEFLNPADGAEDQETLTDEERYMFRRLGLRMKAFLLLGINICTLQSIFGFIIKVCC